MLKQTRYTKSQSRMRLECHPETHLSEALYLDDTAQAKEILHGAMRTASSTDADRSQVVIGVAQKMQTVIARGHVSDLVLSGPEVGYALECLAASATREPNPADPHRIAALAVLGSIEVHYSSVVEFVPQAESFIATDLAA